MNDSFALSSTDEEEDEEIDSNDSGEVEEGEEKEVSSKKKLKKKKSKKKKKKKRKKRKKRSREKFKKRENEEDGEGAGEDEDEEEGSGDSEGGDFEGNQIEVLVNKKSGDESQFATREAKRSEGNGGSNSESLPSEIKSRGGEESECMNEESQGGSRRKKKKRKKKKKKKRRKKKRGHERSNSFDSGTLKRERDRVLSASPGFKIQFSGVFDDSDVAEEESESRSGDEVKKRSSKKKSALDHLRGMSPLTPMRATFSEFVSVRNKTVKKLKAITQLRRKSFQDATTSNLAHGRGKYAHNDTDDGEDESEVDKTFKVVVIGESGVGKSNLISRYVRNEFRMSNFPTVGVEFYHKTVQFEKHKSSSSGGGSGGEGETEKVQGVFWDTAGQEKFMSILPIYYRGAKAAILVYDVTSHETFSKLDRWVKDLQNYVDDNVVIMVIGNKLDLVEGEDATQEYIKTRVKTEEAMEFCQEHSFFFMETSAKSSKNVNEAFEHILRKVYEIDTLRDRICSPITPAKVDQYFVGDRIELKGEGDPLANQLISAEDEDEVGGCRC